MEARARTGAKDGKPVRTRAQEQRLMEDFMASLPKSEVPVDWGVVDATTGFAACEFAESVGADLLVGVGMTAPASFLLIAALVKRFDFSVVAHRCVKLC
jgi:hypothetical protein